MLMRIFLGLMLIISFLLVYPFISNLFTDNVSGFQRMMADIVDNSTGVPVSVMSELETSFWGIFPLLFLILGVGGIAWLIVRDRR